MSTPLSMMRYRTNLVWTLILQRKKLPRSKPKALITTKLCTNSQGKSSVPLCWQCLSSSARTKEIWLGCALCELAGLNGVVAAYVTFSVTARIQTMLYGWWPSFSIKMCCWLQLYGMQWTSRFLVVVASCNNISPSLHKKKKVGQSCGPNIYWILEASQMWHARDMWDINSRMGFLKAL